MSLVRSRFLAPFAAAVFCALAPFALAQSAPMNLPAQVTAGSAFSIPTSGSGQATLTLVGPGQVLRKTVQLGSSVSFAAGVLYNAGDYLVILSSGASPQTGILHVVPSDQPSTVSFLAEPSRLPVDLRDGVSGTVYVFDAWHNLIVKPLPVDFNLSASTGPTQSRTVTTRYGVGWTRMNSASREGAAHFIAKVGGVSSTRVIDEVPGDPCNLRMAAKPSGDKVELQTAPVRDCSGNPVPDGTVVTFTEQYNGAQSTVDVPLKRDIAQVDMPAHPGALISVASGVVAGNEIRWR